MPLSSRSAPVPETGTALARRLSAGPSTRPRLARPLLRLRSAGNGILLFAFLCAFFAAAIITPARLARAEVATLDLLFDLDEDPITGCNVMTSDGMAPGIEIRIRALLDTETSSVTESTHAHCIGADTFDAETPLPPALGTPGLPIAPWDAVAGNGKLGSTLIETHLPLALVGGATQARIHAALDSPSGSDALTQSALGAPLTVQLAVPPVPSLGLAALLGLALVSGAAGVLLLNHDTRLGRSLGVLILAGSVAGIFATPASVKALLGEGTALSWAPIEEVAPDPQGDGAADLDLLNVYSRLDLEANELWLRADAFFGPPICLEWGQVDPGTDFQCTQVPSVDQGPFGFKVAMTFDDGPNPSTTPGIVAILRAENIPATFFMRGDRLQTAARRAIALDIYQDPLFRIANHTYDHPRMPTLTLEEVQTQIEDTSDALREAIDDPCFYPEYFRFPFNAANCETTEIVRANGHAVAGVDVDPVDWCYASGGGTCLETRFPPMDEIWRNDMPGYAVHRLQISTGGIMLMHDIHQNTLNQLPAVIAALRAAGATFVDLSDATLFPLMNANINPPEAPACCDGTIRH